MFALSQRAGDCVAAQTGAPNGGTVADSLVERAQKLASEGLHKDAYDLVHPWLLDPNNGDHADFEKGLVIARNALQRLNRVAEIDELLESAAEVHKNSWRAILYIAQEHMIAPSYGWIIDGKFQRGNIRGGGARRVQTRERDRVRALQLLNEVMPLVLKEEDKKSTAAFFRVFAGTCMVYPAFKLQALTDLTVLPDYEDGYGYYGGGSSDAPVDAEGNPVYYYVPESLETAKNDGERWRWALEQAIQRAPEDQKYIWGEQANFYRSQFGEQTLRGFDFYRNTEQEPNRTASILNLETLTDNETIAKLATGIKRFTLPDEFNYIKLHQKADLAGSLDALADIAKNRRQYDKAAKYYEDLIERFGDDRQKERWQKQLAQITGNWGRFETAGSNVAGLNAELRYVFRNGKKVKLTAQEIHVEKLIADIKAYLKSKPQRIDWQRLQIDQIGRMLLMDRGGLIPERERAEANQKYLGAVVKTWEMPLEPAEKHFDRSATVSFSSNTGGAFLIRAEMEDGNVESAVIWLEDTAIVRKQLDGSILYFVADAQTGEPIAGATLDLFGYNMEYRNTPAPNNRTQQAQTPTWTFQESSHKTDNNGFVTLSPNNRDRNFNTLITVQKPTIAQFSRPLNAKPSIAHLGFENLWVSPRYDEAYNEVKVFILTDRPVYRPLDKVNIKAWVGTAKFDKQDENEWAARAVKYEVYDPRGEKIAEKEIVLDGYGGMTAELELPKDAMLGQYSVQVQRGERVHGFGNFRVEEYKKPEYEVTIDAPKEPVSLGDTITATINAKYYFGSPVSEATVKYKVLRQKASADWYPILPWDWFYGSGYGWFAYDSEWLPGWTRWGIRRPSPPWFPRYAGPPEVVAEAETPIKSDGTVDVVIDTAIAKELFPGDDQRYTITAEVIDNSRRTIVGTGTVLVANEPFKVYAWVDRGFFTPGQKVAASFQSRRLDGKPVQGEAEVKVFRLSYREPGTVSPNVSPSVTVTETEVHSAKVTFNESGKANLNLTAAEPGQYRISCILNGQEGGYVFNVYRATVSPTVSDTVASSLWKYNALELIPDKTEYTPGENVTLRINTDRESATVLLFVRPANGVAAGKPQVLRVQGKSTEVSIPVVQRDMPNFFVEALTITNGKAESETIEIAVPPQQRVLNVEVRPSAETYKPGGRAAADLIVTDLDGKPVVGQIAVTIYDKSVEYISGGSNVGDIKEFFWKWKRHHHPQTASNLTRRWQSFVERGQERMQQLGIFGNVGVEDQAVYTNGVARPGMRTMSGLALEGAPMGGAPMMNMAVPMSPAPASMAMPRQEMAMEAGIPDGMSAGKIVLSDEMQARFDDGGMTEKFVEPTVRSNFADTALWIGALETNERGIAKIELDMPESLTTWKINVWTMALGTRVGHGTAAVITRKDFIIRMQTPRFLIEKDKVVFSANVHNYLASEKTASVSIETVIPAQAGIQTSDVNSPALDSRLRGNDGGGNVQLLDESQRTQTVTIPANGEARIDWLVEAKTAGEAVITMKALTDEESDAMEKTLPVYVHGMLKQDSFSAFIAPKESSATLEVRVPEERKPEQTKLTVKFSPSLAASMIDALPYLVDYPYGCTEQTLNRFLPTVIVRKVIGDGFDIREPATVSPSVSPSVSSTNWAIARTKKSPVFDKEQIDEMVRDGITRLTNMQCSDGGWGWFSGYGERSSAHLTALVMHGLFLARSCDVDVPDDVLRRGREWLQRYQESQIVLLKNATHPEREERKLRWKEQADETDAFVFMVLAESEPPAAVYSPTDGMIEFLQRDRGKLSPYAVAMVGIAESYLNRNWYDLTPYIKILEQYLVQDDENQTAYLNLRNYASWRWWTWHGSEFETQAYYLKLLMRADPKSPVAPRLVKYLLNNRKHATYWNSTRDTAIVIEAFAEYLQATGEGSPNATVEVLVGGEVKQKIEFTPENFLTTDGTLILAGDEVSTGTHKIEVRKTSDAPLYITAFLENFTLEDPIEKAGLEVKIERRIYKLVRDESATTAVAGSRGQVVDLKTEKYKREPATVSPFAVQSGDLVEIELIIESKNDYESLIIEDWKAAGCEPVDLRSGYNGNELGAYVEFRDERVVFFVYRLARGTHSVSYRLRAEVPGEFSALPAKIEAMYAPELRGSSDENKVNVVDR